MPLVLWVSVGNFSPDLAILFEIMQIHAGRVSEIEMG